MDARKDGLYVEFEHMLANSIWRSRLTRTAILIIKTRRSNERLIFAMEIPIHGKTVFILGQAQFRTPGMRVCYWWVRVFTAKCYIDDLIQKNRISIANVCFALKSSAPSAAYVRQWMRSALVETRACRLFGAKPLSKPCWVIVNWTLRNKLQWNLNQNDKTFHSRKCIWKFRLSNGGHFVQGKKS